MIAPFNSNELRQNPISYPCVFQSFYAGLCCLLPCFLAVHEEACADETAHSTAKWSDIDKWMFEVESELLFIDGRTVNERRRLITHRVIAASAEGDFYYLTGHDDGSKNELWRREPFNMELILHGGELTKHYIFNRRYSSEKLQTRSHLPKPVSNDALMFMVPVWPLRDYQAPQDESSRMVFVVGAALESGEYRATERRQFLCGEWCSEFCSSGELDRIWIAEEKNLCVMKREWQNSSTRALTARIVATRIAEMAPGLWMPIEFEETGFGPDSTTSAPTPRRLAVTRILDWKLGDLVPKSLFRPNIKCGSIVDVGLDRFRQVSPGGVDHLDEVASYLRGPGGLPQQKPVTRSLSYRIAYFTVGVLGGIIIGSMLVPRRSQEARTLNPTTTVD